MQGGIEQAKMGFSNATNRQILREFIDVRNTAIPSDAEDTKRNILHNLDKYQYQYGFIALVMVALHVLIHLELLTVLACVAAMIYFCRTKLVVLEVEIERRSICIAGSVITLILLIIFRDASIGLLAISAFIGILVLLHAAFMREPAEFEEEV
ncbi:PRA1 protein [Ordospora pajunii]|jgi:hypothetical protein|uniref:PRA1 protein n=1 Tax=Ordospora pajunii TaxID=3039483 RepID=UPI002952638C|nr:PRA1 protein [Ordospora pajunii]KAH9411991.1 PRA1 protein [Ordospora pajunii]